MKLARCKRTSLLALLSAAALLGTVAQPAAAETLQWRHTHTFDRYEGAGYVRKGVSLFRLGGQPEPATLEVRGQLTGPQGEGWFGMRIELRYRFDDGATLVGQLEGRFQRSADGTVAGPQEGTGQFVGGTGRFQDAKGGFKLRGMGGLSPTSPGILADVYGDLEGDLQLPAR